MNQEDWIRLVFSPKKRFETGSFFARLLMIAQNLDLTQAGLTQHVEVRFLAKVELFWSPARLAQVLLSIKIAYINKLRKLPKPMRQ